MSLVDWWLKRYRIQNTRQYPRLAVSWPIKCHGVAEIEGKLVTTTRDVGGGGVAVIVQAIRMEGSQFGIELYVPPLNRTIQAQAQVLRCVERPGGGFEWGVRFVQIDPEDRKALNETIERFYTDKERVRHRGSWWRRVR